jgi:Leucine-rich repeat (LRR) protein
MRAQSFGCKTIPTEIGLLTKLTELRENNADLIVGSILNTVGNLTKLQYLNFGSNKLTGTIASSLGGLTKLTLLYFGENIVAGLIEILANFSLLQLYLS